MKNKKYTSALICLLGSLFFAESNLGLDRDRPRDTLKRARSQSEDSKEVKRQRLSEDPATPPKGILVEERLRVHFEDFKRKHPKASEMLEVFNARTQRNKSTHELDLLCVEGSYVDGGLTSEDRSNLTRAIEARLTDMPFIKNLRLSSLAFPALSRPDVPDRVLSILSQHTRLQNLTLGSLSTFMALLSPANVAQLVRIRTLRKLNLGCRFNGEGRYFIGTTNRLAQHFRINMVMLRALMTNFQSQLANLQSIDFPSLGFDLNDAGMMEALPSNLISLMLLEENHRFVNQALTRLTRFTNLEELSIHNFSFSPGRVPLFAITNLSLEEGDARYFSHLTNLKRLYMNVTKIDDGFLHHFLCMTALEILELNSNKVVSAAGLASLVQLPRLRVLDIKGFRGLTDPMDVPPLGFLASLTELHIAFFKRLLVKEFKLDEMLGTLPKFQRCFFSVAGYENRDYFLSPEYLYHLLVNHPNVQFNLVSPKYMGYKIQFYFPPYRTFTLKNLSFALSQTERWMSGEDLVEGAVNSRKDSDAMDLND